MHKGAEPVPSPVINHSNLEVLRLKLCLQVSYRFSQLQLQGPHTTLIPLTMSCQASPHLLRPQCFMKDFNLF